MRKLEFKEFRSNEELTKFVNAEKIEPEDIVSINSVAIPPLKLPSIVATYHPFSFHLFYWCYPNEVEENKEHDIEYQKTMNNIFKKNEY